MLQGEKKRRLNIHWPLILLAKFWHARFLTNEILWNVEQKWNYTRLRRQKAIRVWIDIITYLCKVHDEVFSGWHLKINRKCRPSHAKDNWAASWQNIQNECAPSEDSDQPGHPPSLIRVFAVRMKKAWVLSYPLSAQRRLWSDWADAQADLSLRWAHSHFVGFVMRWLNLCKMIDACTIRQKWQ